MRANTLLSKIVKKYRSNGGSLIVNSEFLKKNYILTVMEIARASSYTKNRTIVGSNLEMEEWDLTGQTGVIDISGTFFAGDSGDTGLARFSNEKVILYPSMTIISHEALLDIGIDRDFAKVNLNDGSIGVVKDIVEVKNVILKDGGFAALGVIREANIEAKKVFGKIISISDRIATVKTNGLGLIRVHEFDTRKVEFGGDDISNIIYELSNDYDFNCPEVRYCKIEDNGKKVSFIAMRNLKRFNGDFWNEDLRKKYGTTQSVYKVFGKFVGNKPSVIDRALILTGVTEIEITILRGDEIYEAFDEKANSSNGNISKSCMNGRPREWFDFYAKNNNCSIAVYKVDGKIALRSILWNAEYRNSGKKVNIMDRIYSSDTSLEKFFKAWAIKNGYAYLENQTINQSTAITKGDNNININNLIIKLDECNFEYYPYLDTFYTLSGKILSKSSTNKELRSCRGSFCGAEEDTYGDE